jgi:hypothetical protein
VLHPFGIWIGMTRRGICVVRLRLVERENCRAIREEQRLRTAASKIAHFGLGLPFVNREAQR